MYTEYQIMAKIDIVMADSTSHNLRVTEMVCDEVESSYIPSSIMCNIRPLMMTQHKIKQLFQFIHWKIIHNSSFNSSTKSKTMKLIKVFYVDANFKGESFPFKAIRFLTSLINSLFYKTTEAT